jgi:hypothetical protein
MENDFDSYTIKRRKGIDDLQNIYAWAGNSQGDESCTNDTKVGLASEGWMSYHFNNIDMYDQEAINKESIRRREANDKYIQELKDKGEYGAYFDISIHVKHNPLFDRVQPINDLLQDLPIRIIYSKPKEDGE